MPEPIETRLSRLRERAERALASGRRGGEVLGVLETMTREAPDGSAHSLFAHRHLAEIQLQGSPWRAALHLRRVADAGAADDSVHALMGLCQALLGNYRAAVSAYRKAVHLAPRNPWYHHNLGHLLDVGLQDSRTALDHLRIAHRLQRDEDEITASLAHCLARLGHLDEARVMAERAVEHAPRNKEHRTLLDWILEGAPAGKTSPQRASHAPGKSNLTSLSPASIDDEVADVLEAEAEAATGDEPPMAQVEPRVERQVERQVEPPVKIASDQVLRMLESRMPQAGFSPLHVERAQALWVDFYGGRRLRVTKPAVYAAAIEYAIAKLDCVSGVTQAELARRYGVAPRSISTRYDEIRIALELRPGDPRYAR